MSFKVLTRNPKHTENNYKNNCFYDMWLFRLGTYFWVRGVTI